MPRHSNHVVRKRRAALLHIRHNPASPASPAPLPDPVKNFLARVRDGWALIACHTRPRVKYALRGVR